MKRTILSSTGLITALFAASASAAPYLYTFTGSIDYIEVDGEFLSDIDFDGDYTTTEDTFKVGDVVEYTFLVDFDVAGFCAGPLGTTYSSTCTGVDIPDSATANYFFTDLVSATKLAPPTEEDTTFNYGLSIANLGWLVADTAVFIVSPFNEPVENWVASSDTETGTLVTGTDAWAAPNGNSPYGRINSSLTLTSIVPVTVEKPTEKDHCKRHDGRKRDSSDYHKRSHKFYRDSNDSRKHSRHDSDEYSSDDSYKYSRKSDNHSRFGKSHDGFKSELRYIDRNGKQLTATPNSKYARINVSKHGYKFSR